MNKIMKFVEVKYNYLN